MSLRGLEYAISEAVLAIKRNFLMSIASVMTSALTLAILGGVVLMALGLHNGTTNFLKQFEMAVFLKKTTSGHSIKKVTSAIQDIEHVSSVKLIPADKAWEGMRAKLQGKVELSGIISNPLPDSYRVKLDNPAYTADVAKKIQAISQVDEVVKSQQYVDQALKLLSIVKIIGIIIAVLFFMVAAFIISNTIRLTVYARRREIKIMQMVGASNWFIRLPLLIEGSTLGIIGGAIACLLLYAGGYYVSSWVMQIMPLLGKLSSGIDHRILYSGTIGIGWFLGVVGTMISIQRFLKHNTL
ncbi:MAG: permease-like cell division protein FtsX [Armatimonadota bacterium]